ncbi:MAG: hypothetical protein KDD32_05300 [Bacteroidetes bacterium]|nr:hypothetical protein [Bacteroidota bacterium]
MGKEKELTKKYTISIKEDVIEKGKELSLYALGKENFSGYITYLINREYRILKARKEE